MTCRTGLGTCRAVWRALSVLVVTLGLTAQAETELGAILPENARKVAEHRFKSPNDFDGTIKFYKTKYPDATNNRTKIVNQPGVHAVHIANTSGKGGWEGLNIYEANDEVRIYVVPASGSGGSKKSKK